MQMRSRGAGRRTASLAAFLACVFVSLTVAAQSYDVVIHGGRVLDPETGLDGVRDVGIAGGRIARISAEPLTGKRTIDAQGLVVAPGFIDLHQHNQTLEAQRLKAFDGVTTALELEIGAHDVGTFLREHAGKSLINYGSSASHVAARAVAFHEPMAEGLVVPKAGAATAMPASAEQFDAIRARLEEEIAAGALGIGMGVQYTPGATRSEVIRTFGIAAAHHVPVFVHIRSAGRHEPGSSIESVSEVIGAAAITGAPLHIVHINSSCLRDAQECLGMVAGARARGLDVTTEAYPYIAGMTYINSALFDPGWLEKFDMKYSDLMLPSTGERLTQQRFEELHALPEAKTVIMFNNTEQADDGAVINPLVLIASDGELGHPRCAGTYSRVLSRYVRDQRSLTLMDAVRKMTLMPAQRLEKATPAARRLGRVQEGAEADIVVFDADKIQDRATFSAPKETSVGVRYLLVGGVPVIAEGKLVEDVFPGRAIKGGGE
jgi:N-acyl-D-aspartate/D-glutamate deacylase